MKLLSQQICIDRTRKRDFYFVCSEMIIRDITSLIQKNRYFFRSDPNQSKEDKMCKKIEYNDVHDLILEACNEPDLHRYLYI